MGRTIAGLGEGWEDKEKDWRIGRRIVGKEKVL